MRADVNFGDIRRRRNWYVAGAVGVLALGTLVVWTLQRSTGEHTAGEPVRCDERSPEREIEGGPERGWLWVASGTPAKADRPVKLLFSVEGEGDLRVVAMLGHTVVEPTEGPTRHISSTWKRAGDEWGTIWSFPEGGCWSLSVERAQFRGTTRIWVVE